MTCVLRQNLGWSPLFGHTGCWIRFAVCVRWRYLRHVSTYDSMLYHSNEAARRKILVEPVEQLRVNVPLLLHAQLRRTVDVPFSHLHVRHKTCVEIHFSVEKEATVD